MNQLFSVTTCGSQDALEVMFVTGNDEQNDDDDGDDGDDDNDEANSRGKTQLYGVVQKVSRRTSPSGREQKFSLMMMRMVI